LVRIYAIPYGTWPQTLATSLRQNCSVDTLPFDLKKKKTKSTDPQSKSLAAKGQLKRGADKHLLSCPRACFMDKFLQLDKDL